MRYKLLQKLKRDFCIQQTKVYERIVGNHLTKVYERIVMNHSPQIYERIMKKRLRVLIEQHGFIGKRNIICLIFVFFFLYHHHSWAKPCSRRGVKKTKINQMVALRVAIEMM